MVTRELTDVRLQFAIPRSISTWQVDVEPNLPWAEDHFHERISGQPLNPPPSNEWWPYNQNGNAEHKKDEKFSHTYPERFWPRLAGMDEAHELKPMKESSLNWGIRFIYGDLGDLVMILQRNPRSRQAYLPVWFPEDLTASREGERVPCTLGYHFLQHADGKLHVNYYMRSCDMVRFFRDDVYMAGRLLQWVAAQVHMEPGTLVLSIASLHAFEGDKSWIEDRVTDRRRNYNFGAMG
jgi:hypothetical protein